MREGGIAGERDGETGRQPAPGDAAADAAPQDGRAGADTGLPPSRDPAISPTLVTARTLQWLDARETAPPPELRARMAGALEAAVSETMPGALAEAALSCLKAAAEHPTERASALDLLAADALLTYALEAAAELGAETLKKLAQSYGPDELAALLPREPHGGDE